MQSFESLQDKIPVVVIEVEVEGVEVLERRQRIDVQLKCHVLEHEIQPHLLQLMIRLAIEEGPILSISIADLRTE